jgi:hypothetical protein
MKLLGREDIRPLLEESYGSSGLLLHERELGAEFFDLRSGLAGELFQLFNNYGQKLALVVPDPGIYSKHFLDLVAEHRNHARLRFFSDENKARAWLERTGQETEAI